MSDYLLDTNHASPLVTVGHSLRTHILRLTAEGLVFGIASPCVSEVIFGFGLLPRAEENRRAWSLAVRDMTVYEIGLVEAESAADLRVSLRRRGWQLGIIDALTAVVALRNNLTLLTTDRDFSQVPGLRCENWLVTPSA